MKVQIVSLAAKLLVLSPADRALGLLNRYVLALARYDSNFDVRDRARMLGSLLSGVTSTLGEDGVQEQGGVVLRREQVKMVLFEGKQDVSLDTTTHGEYTTILHVLFFLISPQTMAAFSWAL